MPFGTSRGQGFNNPVATAFAAGAVVLNKNGLFVYSSAVPAFGTLIKSISNTTGFDKPGNNWVQGDVSYFSIGAQYYALQITGGAFSTGGALQLRTSAGPGAQGPYPSAGSAVDFSNPATGLALLHNAKTVWEVNGVLTADNPVTPGTPETFHVITGDAGWSAVAGNSGMRYRLNPDGNVQFTGAAQHASITATLAINSANPLPAVYRPATIKTVDSGNSPLGRLMVEYRTDGILYALANASAPGTIAEIDKAVPLSP